MKKGYPDFKGKSIEKVFNTLSKHNQKIINSYIQYCRTEAGKTTLQKYLNKIIQIAYVIEKPLDSLTLDDVNNFLVILNLSDRTTDTRNDIKKTLKRFLKWKYENWNKRFKELKDIRQKKKGSNEKLSMKDLLTKEELEALIRSAESLRYKALIMLMFESACRPEECLKLKWKDIDFQNKEVSLNSSKTKEARVIPLNESIIHLKRYNQEYPFPNVKESDLIFSSLNDRSKPISNQAVNDYLKKLSERTIKKPLYPYIFRHTRLQEIRSKLSVEAYEKIAGHSIETALEHYGHLDIKEAKEEMLNKIYHIEELTPTEKNEIKKLRNKLIETSKNYARTIRLIIQSATAKTEKEREEVGEELEKIARKIEKN